LSRQGIFTLFGRKLSGKKDRIGSMNSTNLLNHGKI